MDLPDCRITLLNIKHRLVYLLPYYDHERGCLPLDQDTLTDTIAELSVVIKNLVRDVQR